MTSSTRGLILGAFFSLVLLNFSAIPAHAQCGSLASPSTSWTAGTGDFLNPGNWGNGVPTGSTNACIINGGVGTPSTANLGSYGSVNSLQVNSNNTVNVNNTGLIVNGAQILNDGAINLNATSGGSAYLYLYNSTSLSGLGALTLSASSGGLAYIQELAGGVTLTNVSTIQGAGFIGESGLALYNLGTVNANSSGQALALNGGGGIINGYLLEATGGGYLSLDGSSGMTVTNGGGIIQANGGTVQLYGGVVIQGGTLTNTSGFLGTPAGGYTATLDGNTNAGAVTINGTYTSGLGSATYLAGNIDNTGNIQLNGGGGYNSYLTLNSDTILAGGGTGTVTLSTAGGGGGAYIQDSGGGSTLYNVDNMIQGSGTIGNGTNLALNNSGTVNANTLNQALVLNVTGGITNNGGWLEATNGGYLAIGGATVNNFNGSITADGGTVQLYGYSVIQGGALSSVNGGVLGTPVNNTATLDGNTSAGPVTINGNYTGDLGSATHLIGTINNTGNIKLNSGAGINSYLYLDGDTFLTGGGKVTLNANGGGAYISEKTSGSGLTLTNVDNTIQGSGIIGNGTNLALNNAGTVNANFSGQALVLNGTGGITNSGGLLEATGGGVLQIDGVTVNNAGGNITANGGTVQLMNYAYIEGGTLSSVNGGVLGTYVGSTATLDGSISPVTINGTYTGDLGSATHLLGTINNTGNIQLNSSPGVYSYLRLDSDTILTGGGTVTLNANGGGAYIDESADNLTLTNFANTIEGSGVIGNGTNMALNNGGTVNANVSGQALVLNTGTVTNSGWLEATGGGVLQISGVQVNNFNGNITADGGTVQLLGGTVIQGGALTLTNAGGFLGTPLNETATLDGSSGAGPVTINGTYTGDLGSATYLAGTIVNNGNIQLNSGPGYKSYLYLDADTTLQGGGTVTLNANGGGGAFIEDAGAGSTLANVDNTIQGSGVIGNGDLALNNSGTVNANSSSGEALVLNGTGGITNGGSLEASNNGILRLDGVTVNNAGGNIIANAGGTVQLLNNATIQGGTLTNNGGVIGTLANQLATLDGSTGAGAVTISGTYTGDLGSSTYLVGTINNTGNIQVNSGGGSNSYLYINGPTTLQGGGTVTLSTGGGGSGAYILPEGTVTLTNVNNTIQGTGIIGSYGGLTILNESGGTILATAGQTLTIAGGTIITNYGTMEADPGSTLYMDSSTTLTNYNSDTRTLTGGTYIVNGAPGESGYLELSLGTNGGGEIEYNAANIVLNGPGAYAFFEDSNGNDALANLKANSTGDASFTITGGYAFQTSSDFSNAGTVHIGSGSSMTIGSIGDDTYNQSGGSTVIDAGGTLTAGGVEVEGGTVQDDGTIDPTTVTVDLFSTLSGTGNIVGDVTSDGTVILGDSSTIPGTLSVTGDYIQNADGTMVEGLGPSSAYGLLDVGGNVTLSGTLDINLLGGFTPTDGQVFDLIAFSGAEISEFLKIVAADEADWTVLYNPGDNGQVDLVYEPVSGVPEPNFVFLHVGLALALVLVWRRRKKAEAA